MIDQRTETIAGIEVHAWSRPAPEAQGNPVGFRGNGYHIVVRDQASVYEAHGPQPVSLMDRDTFVGFIAILRHTRSSSMVWPFCGQGIKDAGPSPWGSEGWLAPRSAAELTA